LTTIFSEPYQQGIDHHASRGDTTVNVDLLAAGLTTLDIIGSPIDAIPADEGGALISGIEIIPAGTAGGFALVAAVLGLRTGLISALGDDRKGAFVRTVLHEYGVDTSLLPSLPGLPTSATILPVDSRGRRPTLHAPGASLMMEIGEDAIEAASRVKFVHWAAIGAFRVDAVMRARFLQAARDGGALVTCDLIAPGPGAAAELAEIAGAIDCFMPSLAEARHLTGHSEAEDCAAALLSKGIKLVIIKLGGEGALTADESGMTRHPAFQVDVVDTTSCGDAFCAGYVAAVAQGFPLADRVRFASATAALVAQDLGTLGKLQGFAHTLAQATLMKLRAPAVGSM
jgi:sugar/nucleoside kinase (ribokinase family)